MFFVRCPYCPGTQGRCVTTASGRHVTECSSCGRVIEERHTQTHHLFLLQAHDSALPLVTPDLASISLPSCSNDEDPFHPTGFITAFSTWSLEHSPVFARSAYSFAGHLAELERALDSSSSGSGAADPAGPMVSVDHLRAYLQIIDVSSILGLDHDVVDHAFQLFRDCCSATCLRNRSIEALATAALVHAIREAQEPRTLQIMEEMLRRLLEMQTKVLLVVPFANLKQDLTGIPLVESKGKEIGQEEFDEGSFFHQEPPPGALIREVFQQVQGLNPPREREYVIIWKEGVPPISVRLYRPPQIQNEEVERLIKEMLEAGIVRPSVSSFFNTLETKWVGEKAKEIDNLRFKLWYYGRRCTRNGIGVIIDKRSALSPYLFALVMNDLSRHLQEVVPWYMLFTDDIFLVDKTREGEISMASNLPQKEIGKYIKILGEALKLSQPINSNSISVHMPRFCTLLQLNKSAQELAAHIGEVVINKCFCTRRNPISISAAAIYLACQLEDKRKTQAEICKVTGLTEVTLRKVYKELLENWDDLLPPNYTPAVPPEKAFPMTAITSCRSSAAKVDLMEISNHPIHQEKDKHQEAKKPGKATDASEIDFHQAKPKDADLKNTSRSNSRASFATNRELYQGGFWQRQFPFGTSSMRMSGEKDQKGDQVIITNETKCSPSNSELKVDKEMAANSASRSMGHGSNTSTPQAANSTWQLSTPSEVLESSVSRYGKQQVGSIRHLGSKELVIKAELVILMPPIAGIRNRALLF
ncbi:hypothetical protein IEQ34_020981 [Dendrobium chrysotoxum]|uniref:Cyclin-like domain-containing protein n=1 Tax=Dendrobium chrysotoxum TaxID=161865 RepID=A0AAV7G3S7_DENCH|nr:hypothetical protein IEQ34_020981 [Dendrobium chrysotoxum]